MIQSKKLRLHVRKPIFDGPSLIEVYLFSSWYELLHTLYFIRKQVRMRDHYGEDKDA